MSTSGSAPAGRFARAVGWARKAPATRVGGPIGALALAISGIFGGLSPVAASYEEAEAGQTVQTGPLEVSVDRIRAIDTLSPFAAPSEGNRLLVVILDVRNPTDDPVYRVLLTNELTLRVRGAELSDEPVRVIRTNDFSELSAFQPDIDYEIGLVYETLGEAVPEKVDVGIPAYTWREDTFTPGFFDWRDPKIVARGSFVVKDVPDEPDEPAEAESPEPEPRG